MAAYHLTWLCYGAYPHRVRMPAKDLRSTVKPCRTGLSFFRSARKIRPVAGPGAHTAAKASWSMLRQLSFCLICWSTLLPPPQRSLPPRSRGCPSGTTTVPSHRLEPSARDSLRTCRHSTESSFGNHRQLRTHAAARGCRLRCRFM